MNHPKPTDLQTPTHLYTGSLNRRTFLKQTAQAVAGAALVPSLLTRPLGAAPGADRKLGVAIVGLGGYATDSVSPEIAHTRNVRIAAVVTGDPAGKGRWWAEQHGFSKQQVFHYRDMHRLAECEDVDFVHVVTPTGLHAEHTMAAAAAGKHVLCEKPMALNAPQCREMIQFCEEQGVRLGIGYRLHWEPHHVEMNRLVRSGAMGGLQALNTEFSWRRGDEKPWLLDPALAGGGAMLDTGVYLVHAACELSGALPTRVVAMARSSRDLYPKGIEESMDAVLEYPGSFGVCARASYAYHRHALELQCEAGSLSLQGHGGGSTFGQPWREHLSGKVLHLPNGQRFKVEDVYQIARMYDAFAEAILGGAPFIADGHMGLRDMIILDAVQRAAVTGVAQELPLTGPDGKLESGMAGNR
jgi:glucose-fructose oxidoreductase